MEFLQPKDYQTKCEDLFLQYKLKIQTILPHAQIEHIGSSSIPGCISKGDLDVYVAVDFAQHKKAIVEIQKLGFTIKQDTLRTENLCMLEDDYIAIQLVSKNSDFTNFINFRDALINDRELVKQYNQLKQSCMDLNMTDYRKVKSKFIEKTLRNYSSSPQFLQ